MEFDLTSKNFYWCLLFKTSRSIEEKNLRSSLIPFLENKFLSPVFTPAIPFSTQISKSFSKSYKLDV